MAVLKIIGCIVLAAIIAIVLLVCIDIWSARADNHAKFCDDWLSKINESKASVNLLTGDAQIAQLNQEVNQYNHECVRGGG